MAKIEHFDGCTLQSPLRQMDDPNGENENTLSVQLTEFSYPGRELPLLKDISFSATAAKTTAMMGRSGCGKSTLLRLISGLEPNSTLRLKHFGEDTSVASLSAGVVFQDYRLFPWKNVEDNILCAARVAGRGLDDADDLIDQFGLSRLRKNWPKTLSGGEQARVALARCLVQQPKVLLLDEVFRSLDLKTRLNIFEIVRHLTQRLNLVTISVTHDVDEAGRLADKVIVLGGNPTTVSAIVSCTDQDRSLIHHDLSKVLSRCDEC